MEDLSPNDKRRRSMLERYGSEEALSDHYREMQRQSMRHPNRQKGYHKGGFNDPQVAKKASALGVEARRKKH